MLAASPERKRQMGGVERTGNVPTNNHNTKIGKRRGVLNYHYTGTTIALLVLFLLSTALNNVVPAPVREEIHTKANETASAPIIHSENLSTGPPEPTRPPTQAPTRLPDPVALSCCLHSVSVGDLMRQYHSDYFNQDFFYQKKKRDKWNVVAPHKIDGGTCTDYWRRLTLQETRGDFYFGAVLNELLEKEKSAIFPYWEEEPPGESVVPRALFLGDSVSRGAWERLLSSYSHRGVHLAGAPANCYGFYHYKYQNSLLHWLGPCKWDFVQFNIGLHFHPKPEGDWREAYQQGLRDIVKTIHEHSPSAKIVIALTTPSPLDTNATYPLDDGSCPHLAKFHKTGFISSINDVVKSMLGGGNETIPGLWGINDRYSLLAPHLIDYQLPCDVHYTALGYERMAEQDWTTLVTALNMPTMASRRRL